MLLKSQLMELFKNDTVLQYEFNVTLLDSQGRPEEGTGVRVTKEIFSVFFTEFLSSCTVGRSDKVPCVRHDMSRSEWCSVARILIAGVKVGYYSLALSPAFMLSALLEENKLPDNMLINSFKNYVSLEEKENIDAMLQNFEEGNAELLELLSLYNCYKKPTKENLSIVLHELAHQEIVQKPRYILPTVLWKSWLPVNQFLI